MHKALKSILSIALSVAMMVSLSMPVLADRDGNANTGTGGAGGATSQSTKWRGQSIGYRATVYDKTTATKMGTSVDFITSTAIQWIQSKGGCYYNASKATKIDILGGAGVAFASGYTYARDDFNWRNITQAALKGHFTDTGILSTILANTGSGLSLADLTAESNMDENGYGRYKILVEPIAVCLVQNNLYSMTASEWALMRIAGMPTLLDIYNVWSMILPNGMFLERNSNLGNGATPDPLDNLGLKGPPTTNTNGGTHQPAEIIDILGMALVYFTGSIQTPVQPAPSGHTTLVYVSQNGEVKRDTEGNTGSVMEGGDNWWNYNNICSEFPVEYESKYQEYNFSHRIVAKQASYTKEEKYRTEYYTCSDPNCAGPGMGCNGHTRTVFDHNEYHQSNSGTSEITPEYHYTPPVPHYSEFLPLELSVEGALYSDEYAALGGHDGTGLAIDGDVDNYQEKDYSVPTFVQTLDINVEMPFKLVLNNDQFGIPLESQGGINIRRSRPYPVINAGNSKDLCIQIGNDGQLNIQQYYGATMYVSGANSSQRTSSLVVSGVEYPDSQIFTYGMGWRGDTFGFKNIKVGNYILGNTNPYKAWYSDFQMGIYYDYGAHYYAVIRTGTSNPIFTGASRSDPPLLGPWVGYQWKNSNFWVSEVWNTAYQPIFYGKFNSKTVGGNID